MSRHLACTVVLLLATAFALPAVAGAEAPATLQLDAASAPVWMQGRPDGFPGQGNACRIPPPFQPESCICPFVFEPVCGCDGQTYSNACFARCEVRFFTEGACP